MSVAVRGYTSIADSQSTALKGYNCNLLRPVHGMLRQAPQPAFHRAQLPDGRLLQNRAKPLAQKRILVFRMPNRSSFARPASLGEARNSRLKYLVGDGRFSHDLEAVSMSSVDADSTSLRMYIDKLPTEDFEDRSLVFSRQIKHQATRPISDRNGVRGPKIGTPGCGNPNRPLGEQRRADLGEARIGAASQPLASAWSMPAWYSSRRRVSRHNPAELIDS
jgi:hypothetical protein